jgi:hypothetical protein
VVRATGRALHHASKAVHWLLISRHRTCCPGELFVSGASWRLAQGPTDLGCLAAPIRVALIDDAATERVSFDGLALAWRASTAGRITLSICASPTSWDPTGRTLVTAPDAHLTLRLAGLILGRIVPRTLGVDNGQGAITRETSGSVTFGFGRDSDDSPAPGPAGAAGSARSSGRQRSRPEPEHMGSDTTRAFQGYRGDVSRSGIGAHRPASAMDLNLVRARNGRIRGSVEGRLSLGGEQAAMAAEVDLAPGADTSMNVRLTSFRPAAIAGLPTAWAFLTHLDAPVSITVSVKFDAGFKPGHMVVAANL